MIARHENNGAGSDDIWARIAAPLPKEAISWRQDGRSIIRDGKYFARFVSYTDAQFVRERLDSVVPGEWNLTMEMLPTLTNVDGDGVFDAAPFAFKARLTILGVVREDVGVGKDYKQASTDAFKRAAVRFGVGHELYDMDMLWVQMDGDGKYAKPVEDPQAAYDRKHGGKQGGEQRHPPRANGEAADSRPTASTQDRPTSQPTPRGSPAANTEHGTTNGTDVPPCPKCGGRMWDNRLGKKNPNAPDFKCRDRSCDGVIWPPKPAAKGARRAAPRAEMEHPALVEEPEGPPTWDDPGDGLPF